MKIGSVKSEYVLFCSTGILLGFLLAKLFMHLGILKPPTEIIAFLYKWDGLIGPAFGAWLGVLGASYYEMQRREREKLSRWRSDLNKIVLHIEHILHSYQMIFKELHSLADGFQEGHHTHFPILYTPVLEQVVDFSQNETLLLVNQMFLQSILETNVIRNKFQECKELLSEIYRVDELAAIHLTDESQIQARETALEKGIENFNVQLTNERNNLAKTYKNLMRLSVILALVLKKGEERWNKDIDESALFDVISLNKVIDGGLEKKYEEHNLHVNKDLKDNTVDSYIDLLCVDV